MPSFQASCVRSALGQDPLALGEALHVTVSKHIDLPGTSAAGLLTVVIERKMGERLTSSDR
jgi:hypothetical protein